MFAFYGKYNNFGKEFQITELEMPHCPLTIRAASRLSVIFGGKISRLAFNMRKLSDGSSAVDGIAEFVAQCANLKKILFKNTSELPASFKSDLFAHPTIKLHSHLIRFKFA